MRPLLPRAGRTLTLRGTVDAYAELGFGAGRVVEKHAPIDPGVLLHIAQLARYQQRRFRERLDEIEAQLGRTVDS